MRTTPTHPEGGYFYPFYLLDAQGRRLRRIADESADLRSLVRQYSSSSRWSQPSCRNTAIYRKLARPRQKTSAHFSHFEQCL